MRELLVELVRWDLIHTLGAKIVFQKLKTINFIFLIDTAIPIPIVDAP